MTHTIKVTLWTLSILLGGILGAMFHDEWVDHKAQEQLDRDYHVAIVMEAKRLMLLTNGINIDSTIQVQAKLEWNAWLTSLHTGEAIEGE